jgi:hypothetical protein
LEPKKIGRPKGPRGVTYTPTLPLEKLCAECKEVKPASEFRILNYTTCVGNRSQKLFPYCKPCVNIRWKRYRLHKLKNRKPLEEPKLCPGCKTIKHPDDFGNHSYITSAGNKSRKLQARCKECRREHRKFARQQHREYEARYRKQHKNSPAFKERAAANFQRNKERIRLRNIAFRKANAELVRQRYIAAIYKRNAFGCDKRKTEIRAAIAEALESYRIGDLYWDVYDAQLIEVPTIDHIVPLSSGGTNTADNFATTSHKNNSSKNSARTISMLLSTDR